MTGPGPQSHCGAWSLVGALKGPSMSPSGVGASREPLDCSGEEHGDFTWQAKRAVGLLLMASRGPFLGVL